MGRRTTAPSSTESEPGMMGKAMVMVLVIAVPYQLAVIGLEAFGEFM